MYPVPTQVMLDSFSSYLSRMEPIARGLSWKYSRSHPYLGQQDLLQEALIALWAVWKDHHSRVTSEHLCKIGSKAVVEVLTDSYARSRRHGEGSVLCLSFDHPPLDVETSSRTLGDSISDKEVGEKEMLLAIQIQEVYFSLSPVARKVFIEILNPTMETKQLMQALWNPPVPGRNWNGVHLHALQKILELSPKQLRDCLQEIHLCCVGVFSVEKVYRNSYSPKRTDDSIVYSAVPEEVSVMENGRDEKDEWTSFEEVSVHAVQPPFSIPFIPNIFPRGTVVEFLGGGRTKGVDKGTQGVVLGSYGASKMMYVVKFPMKVTFTSAKFLRRLP